jgi:hypothetical protein
MNNGWKNVMGLSGGFHNFSGWTQVVSLARIQK